MSSTLQFSVGDTESCVMTDTGTFSEILPFIPLYFRGAEANTPCVFPFQYGEGGVTHYGCVTYGYPVFFPMFYHKSIICFMFSPFAPQVRCTMAIIGVSVVPTVCCMKIPSAGGKTRRSR